MEKMFNLGDNLYVIVSAYNGYPRILFRIYKMYNHTDKLYPSKPGVNLGVEQYEPLEAEMKKFRAAMGDVSEKRNDPNSKAWLGRDVYVSCVEQKHFLMPYMLLEKQFDPCCNKIGYKSEDHSVKISWFQIFVWTTYLYQINKVIKNIATPDGEHCFSLGDKLYVTVATYKREPIVGVRYYKKYNGKLFSSYPGIALKADQYSYFNINYLEIKGKMKETGSPSEGVVYHVTFGNYTAKVIRSLGESYLELNKVDGDPDRNRVKISKRQFEAWSIQLIRINEAYKNIAVGVDEIDK